MDQAGLDRGGIGLPPTLPRANYRTESAVLRKQINLFSIAWAKVRRQSCGRNLLSFQI